MKRYQVYPLLLLGIFIIIWVLVAISPRYREVWFAENILTVFLTGILVVTFPRFQFSDTSYTLIFVFMTLHTVGSYYSYSEMPWFTYLQMKFGLSRNHYDRVIHFLFGLLFYLPLKEVLDRKLKLRGVWSYAMPFVTITALKSSYEVLEFVYHLVRETSIIATNFLGMQGDLWDTQKDMILGMLGAGMAWGIMVVRKILV